jgi:hypothetical protein
MNPLMQQFLHLDFGSGAFWIIMTAVGGLVSMGHTLINKKYPGHRHTFNPNKWEMINKIEYVDDSIDKFYTNTCLGCGMLIEKIIEIESKSEE